MSSARTRAVLHEPWWVNPFAREVVDSGAAGPNRECANSESTLDSAPELLVERQQVAEAERLHARAAVRDDVVTELEHA